MPTSLGLPPGSLTGVWSEETYAWVTKYLRVAKDPRGGFFSSDNCQVLAEAFGIFHHSNVRGPNRRDSGYQWRDVTAYLPSPGSIQRLVRDGVTWDKENARKLANLDQGQTLPSFLAEIRSSDWNGTLKYTAAALLNINDWGTEWNEQIFDLDLYEPMEKEYIFALFSNPTMPEYLRKAAIDSYAYQAENPVMARLRDGIRDSNGFGDWAQKPAMQGLMRNPSTTPAEVETLLTLIEDAINQTKDNFKHARPVMNYFSSVRDILREAAARTEVSETQVHSGYGVDCAGTCLCNSDWHLSAGRPNTSKEEAFRARFEFVAYNYRKIGGFGFDENLIFNSFYCRDYADAHSFQLSAATTITDDFTGNGWLPSPMSFPWVVIPALAHYERIRDMQKALGGEDVPLEWSSLLLA